jgi:hypothetical protein
MSRSPSASDGHFDDVGEEGLDYLLAAVSRRCRSNGDGDIDFS